MKRLPIASLLLLLLLSAAAQSQWLEKVIGLPDTMCQPLDLTRTFLHNPVTGRLYAAGYLNGLVILDAATGRKHRVYPDARLGGSMVHCTRSGRIALSDFDASIALLDDRADTLVAVLRHPLSGPFTCAYNPARDRLYVNDWDTGLAVVDPAVPAVTRVIPMPWRGRAIACDSVANRVFVAPKDHAYQPVVVDCTTDSIVGTLPTRGRVQALYVHQSRRRLYVLQAGIDSASQLLILDANTLSPADSLLLPMTTEEFQFLADSTGERLYAYYLLDETDGPAESSWDSIAVFDCRGETLTHYVTLPDRFHLSSFCLDARDGKAYAVSGYSGSDSVAVIGPTGRVEHWIETATPIWGVGWSPVSGRAYLTGANDTLYVVDCARDSIIGIVGFEPVHARTLWWNPMGRLYFSDGGRLLGFVDAGDTLAHWDRPLPGMWSYPRVYSSELNRYYIGEESLAAYDCVRDSVLKLTPAPALPYGSDGIELPGRDRLYIPAEANRTLVYDKYRDTIVKVIAGTGPGYRYDPRRDRVYTAAGDEVRVIDPAVDEITATFRVMGPVRDIRVNPDRDEVYVTAESSVNVVDAATLQTVCSFRLGSGRGAEALVLNPRHGRLYLLASDSTYGFDCATRRVVSRLRLPFANDALLNERNDKLWIQGSDSLFVLRCGPDSIVWRRRSVCSDLAWDPARNRVYGADDDRIYVFRDGPTDVDEVPPSSHSPAGRRATVLRGVLYAPEPTRGGRRTLFSHDGRAVIPLRPGPNDVRHLPPGVYFIRTEPQHAVTSTPATTQKVVIAR